MLSTRFLCFGLVGFGLTAQIAAGQSAASSKDPIAALVAKYDSSWDSQDTVAVSRLMASRYQYFTSYGGVLSRAEMLSFLGSPDYALERANRSELVVTYSGPAAVVSSRP